MFCLKAWTTFSHGQQPRERLLSSAMTGKEPLQGPQTPCFSSLIILPGQDPGWGRPQDCIFNVPTAVIETARESMERPMGVDKRRGWEHLKKKELAWSCRRKQKGDYYWKQWVGEGRGDAPGTRHT